MAFSAETQALLERCADVIATLWQSRSLQVEIDLDVQRDIDILAVFLSWPELPLLPRLNCTVRES